MAIYKSDIVDINLESGNIHRTFLKRSIGSADSAADRFGVRVFRGDDEVDLTGCTCYGYFQNSNGENIALTSNGTIDGNVAYVTLPQACYNYEGQFCLAIKLIGGGITGTMRIVDGIVDNTNTGSAVAPTATVPTYSEILSQYDAMVAATTAANTAIAPAFAQATANAAGALVIYDGSLYILPEGHTAGTTWANTTKTSTNMAAQLEETNAYIRAAETSRNLINNTLAPSAVNIVSRPKINETGYLYKYGGSSVVASEAEHGMKVSVTAAKCPVMAFQSSTDLMDNAGLETQKDYTLSFDVDFKLFSAFDSGTRYLMIYFAEGTENETLPAYNLISATLADKSMIIKTVPYTEFGEDLTARAEFTFSLSSTAKQFEIVIRGSYGSDSGYLSGDYISCRNFMLQEGAIATAWKPSDADSKKVEVPDLISRNNPDLTVEKLQQLNRPTRTGSRTLGTAPLCLLHFSDIHGDKGCLANVITFKNTYSSYIADIVHTGDSVVKYFSDGMAFWNDVDGSENILNVIGNHDTRVGDTWVGKTMAECYTAFFAPYISNWGVTYTANKTYYYKDYSTNKVRLITLDIMHQDADQLSWFQTTLAGAITAGLHVIVLVHSRAHWLFDSYETPWDDKELVPGYKAGYSDTSGSTYPENLSNDYANAVDTFITNGGEFICWLHGHTHFKMFAKLHDHQNQLDVAVANAGGTATAWTYVWARIPGTKSEDDFNVLAIDTTSKILRIAKFGVDYDRYMRHVDTISYDYGNRTLLYTN